MYVSIRYDRGLGNAGVYVRARDSAGHFWNFVEPQWVSADVAGCRLFLIEVPDTDPDESLYQLNFPPPAGTILIEFVDVSTGDVVGQQDLSVPVPAATPPAPAPTPVGGALPIVPTGTDLMGNIPVPGTPSEGGANIPVAQINLKEFVNQVRLFMRDHAELNRLIAGEESNARQIMWAVLDALDDFNTDPPFTGFGIYNFPSRSLLVRLTVVSLLESVGLLQTRNQLQFSDGGIQVGINDKTQFIQSWIQLFRSRTDTKSARIKTAINIENAWGGGINSEYRFVNNFFGEW